MTTATVSVEVPEPHFTLFDSQRDGMPEVIVVNDTLLSFQHTELFSWHLRVRLEVQDIAENGMPSPVESKLLFDIGDAIENAVLNRRTQLGAKNAIFLARSTWNEMRELLFQVHDPEITHSTLQHLLESESWERPWEYRMQDDPQWKEAARMFALFPLARGSDA